MGKGKRLGRPTEYHPDFCNKVIEAASIRAAGATLSSIAAELGVNRLTIHRWRDQYPDFAAAVEQAKQEADDRVEASMFQRANGYSHAAVKIFMPQGAAAPVYADYTEHYPPDTGAAMNWLKNRRPTEWRDRVEHTGADGGPIRALVANVDLTSLAREDRDLLRSVLGRALPKPEEPEEP